MRKTLYISLATGTMTLLLTAACAEDSKSPLNTTEPVFSPTKDGLTDGETNSIMDQPVNFSTPEEVEKSMQKISDEGGEGAQKSLENAMKYILYYDLSIGGKKENLYKKLDGKTPNEIIGMMRQR
jgi:hypothetical protein